jgi:hypothetical protein
MQTVKGLIALVLVMAGVFTAVVIYNGQTEPGYEAKMKQATLSNAVQTTKRLRQKAASAVVRHKIKKANL